MTIPLLVSNAGSISYSVLFAECCRVFYKKLMPQMHQEMLFLEILVFIYNKRFVSPP